MLVAEAMPFFLCQRRSNLQYAMCGSCVCVGGGACVCGCVCVLAYVALVESGCMSSGLVALDSKFVTTKKIDRSHFGSSWNLVGQSCSYQVEPVSVVGKRDSQQRVLAGIGLI